MFELAQQILDNSKETCRAGENKALAMFMDGVACFARGPREEGAKIMEKTLTHSQKVLGEQHPITVEILTTCSAVCMDSKWFEVGLNIAKESVEKKRALYGSNSHNTLYSMFLQLQHLWGLGKRAEAEKVAIEIVQKCESTPNKRTPQFLLYLALLWIAHLSRGHALKAIWRIGLDRIKHLL